MRAHDPHSTPISSRVHLTAVACSSHDVRVQRLLPVVHGSAIVLTPETEDFRHLCRTQVRPGDIVVELGCSYGKATKVLCEMAGAERVVGVDLGQAALEACRQVCGARFEHVDVVGCSEAETAERLAALRALLPEVAAPVPGPDAGGQQERSGRFLVYVDIGGNRDAPALLRVIPRIVRSQRPFQVTRHNPYTYKKPYIEKDIHVINARSGRFR